MDDFKELYEKAEKELAEAKAKAEKELMDAKLELTKLADELPNFVKKNAYAFIAGSFVAGLVLGLLT